MNKDKKLTEAVVSCNKRYQEGTLTVIVKRTFKHPVYGKTVNAWKKQIVHHPRKDFIDLETKVFITECAPVSKRKHFIIVQGGTYVN